MDRGAFEGIRIVELATGIAGPYATRFMADQGAEVIKVESASGDPYRGDPGFQSINRNKRSVVLDEDATRSLLATADVIVCDQAGQAGDLRERHPGAIIVTQPTWGERGAMVAKTGTSGQIAAATGIGWNQTSYTDGPVHVVVPLAFYGAGVLGAVAIAAALYAREIQGCAPTYEVSAVAGAGVMQIGDFWTEDMPRERDGSCPLGSAGRIPVYRLFEADDGKWLFVACGTPKFYERMMQTIGLEDLLDDHRLPFPPWGLGAIDPLGFITPILEEVFASRSREEWIAALRAADVPCQPVQTRSEFLDSDLAAANIVDGVVDHPKLGEVRLTNQPLVLESCPAAPLRRAPLLGEHTDEVMMELGASSHQPGVGEGQGQPPLSDVRALDLSSFIAGPVITRHLAMLGADVIKLESPAGDAFRVMGAYFNGWNQGKRGVVVDLRDPAGQSTLHDLARSVDVVVENFRPAVADRLACDEDSLRAARSDLILLKSPGYGADEAMADQPAFDPLLQALGGIMAAQGGTADPVFLTVPVHDAATPIIAAFGAVSALFHRARTGEGQTVRTSLAQTVAAVQAAEYVRYPDRGEPAVGGFDHKGSESTGSYVETEEGWVWSEAGTHIPVERNGFVFASCAVSNDLITEQVHPEFGLIRQTGQFIVGAGPAPFRSPMHGEHQEEVLGSNS
jgi:crotonobetainyl-CoA:carnitine CoA-transferase CaiB-like acyl-CoA transferase